MNDRKKIHEKTAIGDIAPKPRSKIIGSDITSLPKLTPGRRLFRKVVQVVCRFLAWLFLDIKFIGLENIPDEGSALIVSNHLGDVDAILGWAYTPRIDAEVLIKSELHDFFLLGWLMDQYGVIWIHRGQPDRRAIRAALQGLEQGRCLGIAPEGRESLSGSLEEGTQGAAYLAIKAKVGIVPITFTGTENAVIYNNIKRFRRSKVTINIGSIFHLASDRDRKAALEDGTRKIMTTLARQLPPRYRGVYSP